MTYVKQAHRVEAAKTLVRATMAKTAAARYRHGKEAMVKAAMLELAQALRSGDPELVKTAWAFPALLPLLKGLGGKKALGWLGSKFGGGKMLGGLKSLFGRGAAKTVGRGAAKTVGRGAAKAGGRGVGKAVTAAPKTMWQRAKKPLMYGGFLGTSMLDPDRDPGVRSREMPLYDVYREHYRQNPGMSPLTYGVGGQGQ